MGYGDPVPSLVVAVLVLERAVHKFALGSECYLARCPLLLVPQQGTSKKSE
jgi:hypothetical protein